MANPMRTTAQTAPQATTVTLQPAAIEVPAWAWLALALALLATFVMVQENGALLDQWRVLHELFHDGRHGLGFPCH